MNAEDRMSGLVDSLQNRAGHQAMLELAQICLEGFVSLENRLSTIERAVQERIAGEQAQEMLDRIEQLEQRRIPVQHGNAYADLQARIDSLESETRDLDRRVDTGSQRLDALETWRRVAAVQPHIVRTGDGGAWYRQPHTVPIKPGPLPAVTDPEQLIRDVYDTLRGLQDAEGRPGHIWKGSALIAVREVLWSRGIDPDLILRPRPR